MIRQFENKMNSSLYIQNSEAVGIVAGQFGDYDVVNGTPEVRSQNSNVYDISDCTTFTLKRNLGQIAGFVAMTAGTNTIVGMGSSFTSDLKVGDVVVINTSSSEELHFVVKSIESDTSLTTGDNAETDFANANAYQMAFAVEPVGWLSSLRTVFIEDLDTGDKFTRKIIKVFNYPYKKGFTLDKAVYGTNLVFRKYADNISNTEGVLLRNTLGENIKSDTVPIHGTEFVKCTAFKLNQQDKKILIYDKRTEPKTGTAYILKGMVYGGETKFLEELSSGDKIFIGDDLSKLNEDTLYTVKNIHSNTLITLEEKNANILMPQKIYRSSRQIEDIESIVSGIYDIGDITNNNVSNVMAIRPNRTIFYRMGADTRIITGFKGKSFSFKADADVEIYRLSINGMIVDRKYYTKTQSGINVDITITSNKVPVKMYNNYATIITYGKTDKFGQPGGAYTGNDPFLQSTQAPGEYVKFVYAGYRNNYNNTEDFITSLISMPYVQNFSESMNYQLFTTTDPIIGREVNTRLAKKHKITYSTNITNEFDNNVICGNTADKLYDTQNFRVVKYSSATTRFDIYNNCQLTDAESESIADDANIITTNVSFQDKVSLIDNSNRGPFKLYEKLKCTSVQ